MTKTPMRSYLNVVAAADELALWQTNSVALDDLLREGLRCLAFVRAVAKGGIPGYFVRRNCRSSDGCSGQ
jgi:hypothetical protein